MRDYWRSAQAMQKTAGILLALAIVFSAVIYFGSQKAIAIQGPGVLQAVSPDHVWLGVNNELWVLDPKGHRVARKSGQDFGFTRGISNIAPAPNGEVLLTVRGDPRWKVVRISDMAVLKTITPQWPAEFEATIARGNHLSVAPNGDVAVATGGGHTVLLFDSNGTLKARTRQGTYRFTNGLWHSDKGWWTTDTNRFHLRLLDGETLGEKESLALRDSETGFLFLGELLASRGAPQPLTGALPVATVSRLGTLMEPGHVVDVFPDGAQALYNKEPMALIPDFTWFNDQLLVVDGGSYQIRRFSAQRHELEPFGDAQVNEELRHMLDRRVFWSRSTSQPAFLLAASMLILGIAAYQRHKKLGIQERVKQRHTNTIGTSEGKPLQLFKQWAQVFAWPFFVRLIVVLVCLNLVTGLLAFAINPGLSIFEYAPVLMLLTVPVCLAAYWQKKRYWKLSAKPQYEALLNRRALSWLLDYDDWDKIKQAGEVPRESLHARSAGWGWSWRTHWLLVTNQRVLLFAANARERRLISEWPRTSLVFAGRAENDPTTRTKTASRWREWIFDAVNLRLRFQNGDAFEGVCPSQAAAERTTTVLSQTMVKPRRDQVSPAHPPQSEPLHRRRVGAWHPVAASFLVPGTGQWLQNRFVTGAVYFTASALFFVFGLWPLIWAMSGPKMDVSFGAQWLIVFWWVVLATLAAKDAYHFIGEKHPSPVPSDSN